SSTEEESEKCAVCRGVDAGGI
ncbi:3-ketosteroid dehydrogenase, partial [Escherichia coli]|nr:3-ketosteroid dehydrogenase [Escherichia coli]EFO4183686.1 3-ketosteroid dehydrogenase [Escherichia coli]EFO4194030.1 3-ketosteroid dehydrogenase [Escherichia coli]